MKLLFLILWNVIVKRTICFITEHIWNGEIYSIITQDTCSGEFYRLKFNWIECQRCHQKKGMRRTIKLLKTFSEILEGGNENGKRQ